MYDKLTKKDIALMEAELEDRRLNQRPTIMEEVKRTREFGDIVIMEVGALLVGKIVNHHGKTAVRRGQEKGYFQFGGSTVVMLLKRGAAEIDGDILANSKEGIETVVRFGERIGAAV